MDNRNIAEIRRSTRLNGWEGLLMYTGTGGIPARAGSTAGKADDVQLCTVNNDGTINTLSSTFTVFNPFDEAIDGSKYITVKLANGTQLVVDSYGVSGDGEGGGGDPPSGPTDCTGVFECFEGRCCEHDATDRCKYKRDAIKSVSLDDGAGRTWRQKGKSTFSSLNDCTFEVQVLDQNCIESTATVERTANGWKVSIPTIYGAGDYWESTAGATECTGEDSGLTKTGGGTGTVKFEHEGECPTTGCCEELGGSVVPRIEISGIPDVVEHSYQFSQALGGNGGTCFQFAPNQVYYNRLVSRPGGQNGVYYGPPMIENPLGSQYGLIWEPGLNICVDLPVRDEYYNNGILQCVNEGIPCSDPTNPGDRSSISWTTQANGQLKFSFIAGFHGGIQATDVDGNNGQFPCNAAATPGGLQFFFDPQSCDSGNTWRDFDEEYDYRYIFTTDPAITGKLVFP